MATWPPCLCHTEGFDTNSRLIIGYAWPAGSISQGLFKVLVHNRASNLDRITAYRMQFFKNDGIEETAAAYTFAQQLVVYTAFTDCLAPVGYMFTQGMDSDGNDYANAEDNIPELVKRCNADGDKCRVGCPTGLATDLLHCHAAVAQQVGMSSIAGA
jgi:hypothetical protein